MKIGDIVWFQAYKDCMPIQGRIVKIGSQVELGCGWDESDTRVFYALESLKDRPFIFTRTTGQWLSTEMQSIEHKEGEDKETMDYWDRIRRSRELAAMDNQSPYDSGINPSY
jgi:hypothetical protein